MNRLLVLLFCAASVFAASPDAQTKSDILAAMDAWKQAMLSRDRAALEKLYSPDITYSHSNGKNETKAEAIEAVVKGKGRFEAIDFGETSVRVYGNTALVKSNVTIRTNNEGTVNTIPLTILHASVKNPSGWQMTARHATRLAQ